MILLVEWYIDPIPERAHELEECLRINAALNGIERIYLFGTAADLLGRPPYSKIEPVEVQQRPTFAQLFAHAAEHGAGQVCCIANSDIFFDGTLARLPLALGGKALALTRWDVLSNEGGRFVNNPASQDAWIFVGGLRVDEATFTPGILACDKRLAALLAERCEVTNPSLTIRAWHLHLSRVRRDSVNLLKRVAPPYASVPITELP